MKRISGLTLIVMMTIALAAALPRESAAATEREAILKIEGMTCGGCALSVKAVARKIDGVTDIEVDWKNGRAVVRFDPEIVTAESIAETIEKKLTYKTEVLQGKRDE